ncbi:unnamed protein product [Medioppia subpectinata]|uniref:Uncharacterized protein n=1 Tax=Medioppia subpectinata TaxID=1979941 RepID=A0A7R9KF07_9ACAR|nr:unnamed protein product [Medioppia subpectinata]CAG2101384.1 unnamed protein product [Medioppia subpectinata]
MTNVLRKLNDQQFDKIAIVSVIGPHFEGNTFTANLILNYLQRRNSGHTYPDQWPRDLILRYNSGFKSIENDPDDRGQQKCPGVEMWSEPFIVRDGTTRVAVLLVNVQNFAYTLADLIRGDTSLIHMFRLILSVSTIVAINKPGLKKYPDMSGDKYKLWIHSYDYLLRTLTKWEGSDCETLMANGSQISDRSENYRKLSEEFNKFSAYLVSCPTNDVKNIDWKLRELCPQYVDQMNTFIRINALDVDNRLNGITFTNTDQLMKVIMGKIQELNNNNSVNTGPTHEPDLVPEKPPTPTPLIVSNERQTPRTSGQSPVNHSPPLGVNSAGSCDAATGAANGADNDVSESQSANESVFGDQLVTELKESFTKSIQTKLNDRFEPNMKCKSFDKFFATIESNIKAAFNQRWNGDKKLKARYSRTLDKFMDDRKVIYANFDSNYNSFVANCEHLCESDVYFINETQLKQFLLTDEKIKEFGTFTDETFHKQHNTVCDTIWTRVADRLSLKQRKPSVINTCKESFDRYIRSVHQVHLANNQQNHQFVITEMNRILLHCHRKYCTQFEAKLIKSTFIKRVEFDHEHKQLLDQLWSGQEQLVMAYKTRFADTYLREICAKNRENIALNINHSKAKYWALNERKRNKTHTLIMDFESKPIVVYYVDQTLGSVDFCDPNGHLESNCVVFGGQNMLYGREAEQHLNGHTFAIKDLMGRDVTDDELNRYPFDFVDKRHPKVRLVFEKEMNIELYIESLLASQVLDAKTSVEQVYENYMKNVVFILSTDYTIRKLNAFRDAATIAGIEHVQFITEMTSVAVNFGLNLSKYKRNTHFPDVFIILLTDNVCELALVEYKDMSVKYNAYKRVDIDWPSSGDDFSAVNNTLSECTQKLFKQFRLSMLTKGINKIYHCFIVGDTDQTEAIDFEFLNDYCSQKAMDDWDAIRIGAVYYSNYYETNGHNIPITGVLFRDIVCHISSGHKSKTLLHANHVPQKNNHVKYKLYKSDPFPITVRITEGPDSVIKEYVLSEYPTRSLPYQTLYIDVFATIGANNTLNISVQIDTDIGPSLAHWHFTQRNYSLTECQISEQTELVANLVKPVTLDTHCSPVKSTIDDCDYYSNDTNAMTFTTNETKSDANNDCVITGEYKRSAPVTKQRPSVTENELDAFVTTLIEKYTELISQLLDTCDLETQAYERKSREVRNQALKQFDTEFGRKEPQQLVTNQRLTLIARLDSEDMECMTKAKEMMAKSGQNLQELLESCVKEFNDKMIAAIDEDIENNAMTNNYDKIYTTKMCRKSIDYTRYVSDGRLRDMQREAEVPNTLLSNSQLMERLHKMYDKSYRYFTTALDQIRHGEEQLVNSAIELTIVRYRDIFRRLLMSKFYIPSDLNAIHNQLVSKCLALLAHNCTFTSAQSDLEDRCVRKCKGQLSDTFTQIKGDYTAKLRRLFALNVNLVRDMHRKYCQNISPKHLDFNFIAINELQRLLESEKSETMARFGQQMDALRVEWDPHLVGNVDRTLRGRLDQELVDQIREYELKNFRNASGAGNIGVYFERRVIVTGYYDQYNRAVQFVPNDIDANDNHSKHYVDNCIAFNNNNFIVGRKAKQQLTANSLNTEFDVKDLLGRDRVDTEELKRYPFKWCSVSPPRVHRQPNELKCENDCLLVETLVALQVLDRAKTAMKTLPQRAVFCVPTRYNTKQRRAMLDVGLIAGFDRNNVHIVNEMTAAAIAYVIDTRRKSIVSEIIIIFAIHDNHCECGLIEVDNNCIKHLSYGVVDLNNFNHFINNTLWLKRVDKCDLSRVVVIGHSDQIPDFKEVIKAEIAADFATKQNILYACDPTQVIAKGTVYYGQMMDKKLDTIDVREIMRTPINLLIQKNNDKQTIESYEMIPMNPNPNQYQQLNEIKVTINSKSFPIKLCQMEGDTVVKTFMVNDKPSKYWLADTMIPWTKLTVRYRMDRDTLGVCLNATLKPTYGSESAVDLDKVDEYGLSYQCITGQRIILRELGVLGTGSVPAIAATNRHQSMAARVQSVGSASLTPGPSRVASVPNAISAPPMATAVAADAVQEFSQLCAAIRVRLETCGAIATKKRKIAEKLLDCEKCFKTDAKTLEEQKQQLFRLIDGYNLRDKLITN